MASGSADEDLVALAGAMIAAWRIAPNPPPTALPDNTRTSRAHAGAVAVAWGWTARVVRMAEAALQLHRDGFDVEVAPILRSMLDHAIALCWVADQRGTAYQTLAREKADGWDRFQRAQAKGWTLEGEAAALLAAATTVETDPDTLTEDTMLKTFNRAQRYDLGELYQAWMIETWSTHATLISADPYADVDPSTSKGRLYRAVAPADGDVRVAGAVVTALHTALAVYETIDANAFPGRMSEWNAEADRIMAIVRRHDA
jgi:hypothetical protein